MILEKIAIGTGVVAIVGAVGAWAAGILSITAQQPGITLAPDLIVQLVATVVMVAIAYGTLRSEVKATRDAHEKLDKRFDRFEETLNEVVTQLAVLRSHMPNRNARRREPTSDAEDV